MPVIGGTGVFGFARGKVHLKTHSYNATTGNAIVKCDIYVFHY
ncbi:unnamed protein product [Linum tenue]|uniref:Dirigent protein n=2 Tax=Linum tenue TaxID=586396 RepID=A0AAV0N6J5_9ROSI|nr:unnamed protein product [Linum tenue]